MTSKRQDRRFIGDSRKRDLHFLLGLGAKFFPADAETKKPIIKGWQEEATGDVGQLKRWARKFPGCAWGIACGPSAFHVIDVDGADGELSVMDKELPPTLEVETQSGNRHLYYKGRTASKNRKIPGVDIKSVGGLVIAPGSLGYKIVEAREVVDAPEWSVKLVGEPGRREREGQILSDDEPADVERTRRWLGSTAEPSVEGQGGNDNAFRVACRVKDFGVSEHTCLDLMMGGWNERCEPPWDIMELAEVVENAYEYARGNQGNESASVDFDDDIPDPPETDRTGAIAEFNHNHAVLASRGTVRVLRHEYDEENEIWSWEQYTKTDFKSIYENRKIEVPNSRPKPFAEYWLRHRNRRQYDSVIFDPAKPENEFTGKLGQPVMNLWTGWALEPSENGSWDLLRDRIIRDDFCDRREDWYRFMWNWISFLAIHPETPAGVLLAIRGGRGVGKGTLGNALRKWAGPHGMYVNSPSLITGRFNNHFRDKIFTFCDEGFWAGDKSAESRVKSMVTEPVISYEAKGRDAITGPNRNSIYLASNEDWVFPAGLDERRCAVFDARGTGLEGKKNKSFWKSVYRQLYNEGGINRMLHDALKNEDVLDGWSPPGNIPITQALLEQKRRSMSPAQEWWCGFVDTGQMPDHIILKGGPWGEAEVSIDKDHMYDCLAEYMQKRRLGRVPSKDQMGKELRTFGVESHQIMIKRKRIHAWRVPNIDRARKIIEDRLMNQ